MEMCLERLGLTRLGRSWAGKGMESLAWFPYSGRDLAENIASEHDELGADRLVVSAMGPAKTERQPKRGPEQKGAGHSSGEPGDAGKGFRRATGEVR